MTKSDDKFTKIAGHLLLDVRDLVDWGIDKGHTTADKLRLTITARREEAKRLVDSGMSQRQAAKALGVSREQVRRDVTPKVSKGDTKRVTKAEALREPDADEAGQDNDSRDSPFLVYTVCASDAWQWAERAATCLPGIIEQTKPSAEDWATMVEMTRKAAEQWSRLLQTVEATPAPATRRTKKTLVA